MDGALLPPSREILFSSWMCLFLFCSTLSDLQTNKIGHNKKLLLLKAFKIAMPLLQMLIVGRTIKGTGSMLSCILGSVGTVSATILNGIQKTTGTYRLAYTLLPVLIRRLRAVMCICFSLWAVLEGIYTHCYYNSLCEQ